MLHVRWIEMKGRVGSFLRLYPTKEIMENMAECKLGHLNYNSSMLNS
jgi:hypothetical protein